LHRLLALFANLKNGETSPVNSLSAFVSVTMWPKMREAVKKRDATSVLNMLRENMGTRMVSVNGPHLDGGFSKNSGEPTV